MPRPRRRLTRDPLILELTAAIGAGRITIGPIHDEREFVHGYTFTDGAIVLNPAASMVEVALHEAMHRLRPAWTERSVRSKVTRILRSLSMKEVDTLYTLILSSAKARKTPIETT